MNKLILTLVASLSLCAPVSASSGDVKDAKQAIVETSLVMHHEFELLTSRMFKLSEKDFGEVMATPTLDGKDFIAEDLASALGDVIDAMRKLDRVEAGILHQHEQQQLKSPGNLNGVPYTFNTLDADSLNWTVVPLNVEK